MSDRQAGIGGMLLGVTAGIVLSPAPALAHGPPDWLLWPTVTWFAFALFVLFGGTGTFVAKAASRSRASGQIGRAVFYVGSAISGCGMVLAIVLAVQGPWSRPIAVLVGLVASLLGAVAFVARRGTHGP